MTVTPTVGETYTVEQRCEMGMPVGEFDVTVTAVAENGVVTVEAESKVVKGQVKLAKETIKAGHNVEYTNYVHKFAQVDSDKNVVQSPEYHYDSKKSFNNAIVK